MPETHSASDDSSHLHSSSDILVISSANQAENLSTSLQKQIEILKKDAAGRDAQKWYDASDQLREGHYEEAQKLLQPLTHSSKSGKGKQSAIQAIGEQEWKILNALTEWEKKVSEQAALSSAISLPKIPEIEESLDEVLPSPSPADLPEEVSEIFPLLESQSGKRDLLRQHFREITLDEAESNSLVYLFERKIEKHLLLQIEKIDKDELSLSVLLPEELKGRSANITRQKIQGRITRGDGYIYAAEDSPELSQEEINRILDSGAFSALGQAVQNTQLAFQRSQIERVLKDYFVPGKFSEAYSRMRSLSASFEQIVQRKQAEYRRQALEGQRKSESAAEKRKREGLVNNLSRTSQTANSQFRHVLYGLERLSRMVEKTHSHSNREPDNQPK